MRGHEDIIAMRKMGQAPANIHINDYPCHTDWYDYNEEATVCVAGEPIKTLDLRFLVGMAVHIASCDESRAKALFEACKRASCKFVIACHIQENVPNWKQAGWIGVWRG